MTSMRGRGFLGNRGVGIAATLLWYAVWAALGLAAAAGASVAPKDALTTAVPWFLLAIFFYWQMSPILTANLGTTLDLKKLLAWPIPERSLFAIEVVLRITTGFEMVIFMTVAAFGLARNAAVPAWAPFAAIPPFAVFNLLVATGLRNLLERVFARKWLREAFIFVFVIATALPQLLAFTGAGRVAREFFRRPGAIWPWSAAAGVALGETVALSLGLIAVWIGAAYAFGRNQFARSLRFDVSAAQATTVRAREGSSLLDRMVALPARLLRDPLGALVEKELRSLVRSPRFRLVFLMGFSFGFLIWLPLLRNADSAGVSQSYPVYVAIYGLLLLAEVVVWNVFGFDRGAARFYFAAPVPFSKVLIAKNVATLVAVLFEVALIAVVCTVLPIGIEPVKILEALLVAVVFSVYMTATGNVSSIYYPRAVNPEHSWGRAAGSRFQFFLLFLFPLLLSPVLLAYGARYAFESEAAFYIVLAIAAGIGLIYYSVALDSAIDAAHERRERLLGALAEAAGPLVTE